MNITNKFKDIKGREYSEKYKIIFEIERIKEANVESINNYKTIIFMTLKS
jgi:hypothetical protein